MTEREVAAVALVVAAACLWHPPVPWWLALTTVLAAASWRHPVSVGLALVACAACLADRAFEGLSPTPLGSVQGQATVMSDPEMRFGAASLVLRVDGDRYLASIPVAVLDDPAALLTGHRLDIAATVRPLDVRDRWRASRHIVGRLAVTRARRIDDGAVWWRLANGIRDGIGDGVADWDRSDRALLAGVVLGDDRDQSPVEVHRFRVSGLAHLLAVSGQNLALVVALAAPVLHSLTRRPRFVAVVALIGVMVCVTRADPSVVRAAAMGLVAAAASVLGRRVRAARVVGVATIGCLLVDPLLVHSAGFRLSMGAVIAMVALVRPISERIVGPRWLRVSVAASLAAHVGTAPQLVGWSGSVPLLGPLVNVVAAPVGAALMSWGCVAAPLAGMTGGAVHAVLDGGSLVLVRALHALATAGAHPMLPRLGMVGVVASVAAVGSVLVPQRRIRLAVLAVAAIVVCVDAVAGAPRGEIVAGGASVCAAGGRGSMVLASQASSDAALSLIAAARLRSIDEVIVLGGGLRTSGVVADLRSVIDVGRVRAVDPDTIVGSVPIGVQQPDPGNSTALVVDVDDADGGGWTVDCPLAAPRVK